MYPIILSITIFLRPSQKKERELLIKTKHIQQLPSESYLCWFAWCQIFLALFNLKTLKKNLKNTKHIQTENLTHSSKLEADINGTTVNQKGKIPGEKKKRFQQSHILMEVLEKPKLNLADV